MEIHAVKGLLVLRPLLVTNSISTSLWETKLISRFLKLSSSGSSMPLSYTSLPLSWLPSLLFSADLLMLENFSCPLFLHTSLTLALPSPYLRSLSTLSFSSSQSHASTPSRAVRQPWEAPYSLLSSPGFSYSFQAASILSGAVVCAAVPAIWRVGTGVRGHQHKRLDRRTKNKCGSMPSRRKLTVKLGSKGKMRWDCLPSPRSLSLPTLSTRPRHAFLTEMRSMPRPQSARAQ